MMDLSFKINTRLTNMFYGQFELDKVIYNTFFKEKRDGFFVECGSFDGLTESTCKFFEETMGWHGLNIEPVPYAFNRLIKNRPDCINENCALSSFTGKAHFTNAIHPINGQHFGNGSLQHSESHKLELIQAGCKFDQFEVDCFKFSDLYKKHSIQNIDLFVLDVEGHELSAISGILEIPSESLPKIFCVEYTISGLDHICNVLSRHYTLHSKYGHNAFFMKK